MAPQVPVFAKRARLAVATNQCEQCEPGNVGSPVSTHVLPQISSHWQNSPILNGHSLCLIMVSWCIKVEFNIREAVLRSIHEWFSYKTGLYQDQMFESWDLPIQGLWRSQQFVRHLITFLDYLSITLNLFLSVNDPVINLFFLVKCTFK